MYTPLSSDEPTKVIIVHGDGSGPYRECLRLNGQL